MSNFSEHSSKLMCFNMCHSPSGAQFLAEAHALDHNPRPAQTLFCLLFESESENALQLNCACTWTLQNFKYQQSVHPKYTCLTDPSLAFCCDLNRRIDALHHVVLTLEHTIYTHFQIFLEKYLPKVLLRRKGGVAGARMWF